MRLTEEQWRTVLELSDAAADLPPQARRGFLDTCGLPTEIVEQALLLIDDFGAQAEAPNRIGSSFGRFVVTAFCGSGGVGDVYRANDTELDRTVALKFLRPGAVEQSGTVERFIREARTVSALNHPNIVTVHEVLRSDGELAIVMEFVEGTPLRALSSQTLPLKQVIGIGRQMALALAAAHQGGIVHRDIKPENAILRPDGSVKVLDFGLATSLSVRRDGHEAISASHLFAGTWRYMSPEQSRGEMVSAATDIFSLGLVFCELLTGRPPDGAPPQLSLSSDTGIPVRRLSPSPEHFPQRLRPLLRSMLSEVPAQRPSAASVASRLAEIEQSLSTTFRRRLVLAAIPATLGPLALFYFFLQSATPPRVDRFTQLTNDDYFKPLVAGNSARSILTDGSRLYFTVLTGAARSEIAQVAQTGGDTSTIKSSLTSPILFDLSRSRSELLLGSGNGIGDVRLWTQMLPGGSVRPVGNIAAHGASWSPDGRQIVYAARNELQVVSAFGRNSKLLDSFEGRGQTPYWPRWSPDGRRIRFSLYDNSTLTSSLWEIDMGETTAHRLIANAERNRDSCCGSWTPDGRYYFFVSSESGRSDIWALRSRSGLAALLGGSAQAIQLTAGPLSYYAPVFSGDGRQMFVLGNAGRVELVQYSAPSGSFDILAEGVSASKAYFSRDRRWLAYVSLDEALWRCKPDGSERAQISPAPLKVSVASWSPDGSQLVFSGLSPGQPRSLYTVSAWGRTIRLLVTEKNHDEMDPDWSADGKQIVFSDEPINGKRSVLKRVNLQTDTVSVLHGSEGLRSPHWSPDGRYICALDDTMTGLMLSEASFNQWRQIAKFRMGYPNWSHDGKYIYVVRLTDRPSISRIRVANGEAEVVVDMKGKRQYWGEDAWLGLTGDDRPMLSRNIGMQQLFALHLTLP